MPSARQNVAALIVAALLLIAVGWRVVGTSDRRLTAGFWFEPVAYDDTEAMADRLGGPLTADELASIRAIALAEVTRAFAGLPIVVSDRRDATYRVRVVQELRN